MTARLLPYLLPCLASLVASSADAQSDAAPPPTQDRVAEQLAAQLQATAGLDGVRFDAEWSWFRTTTGSATRSVSSGTSGRRAAGAFAPDMLYVRLEGERGKPAQEVLQAGRFAIARADEDGAEWQLAGLGAPDGVGFVPDPVLLLRALALLRPAVADRSIEQQDGGAVELVALTLDDAQVAQLVRAGAIEEPNPFARGMQSMLARGRITADQLPKSVVDVAVEFDVATRHVRRLEIRAIVDRPAFGRGDTRRGADGGGAGADAPVAEGAGSELEYEHGLPVRATDGKQVCRIELRFRAHGEGAGIELDDRQRRLLDR